MKVVEVVEKDPSLLTCCNGGCNQKYREEDNHDTACQYHAKGPVFWDGGKYWACCPDQKKWDWDDFVLIPGCVMGRHSNIAPKAPEPEPMNNAPIQCNPCGPGVEAPGKESETPEEAAEPVDDMVAVPDVKEDGSTTCGNHGCRRKYNVNDTSDEFVCNYHSNAPLFHDGKKGYTCCNVHVYDFDDFMKIPTCAVGKCVPKTKLVKKEESQDLLDME